MTKKAIALLLALVMCLSLVGCSGSGAAATEDHYKIGVIVYNTGDEEVIGFREYLKGYIEKNFEMVEFVYSDSIRTPEQEMAFIQNACDNGVKGFMSFRTFDLKAEVELCEKNEAFYMLASGTVDDEEFDAVADSPWFLGMFGPGIELEYRAGLDMAKHFAREHTGSRYLILSGGAGAGNDMHYQRTLGMLNGFTTLTGVTFGRPAEELAAATEPVTVNAGRFSVTIVPGYMSVEESRKAAIDVYKADSYDVVMSTLNAGEFTDALNGSEFGMVDSYNTRNLQLFVNGKLHYLVGKYSSSVGPAFALMLNALTGYGEDFRDDGRAIKVAQSFWISDNMQDYTDKYALSVSEAMNAYNFADLSQVCRIYNPDANLIQLIALAQANSYEQVLVRRGA